MSQPDTTLGDPTARRNAVFCVARPGNVRLITRRSQVQILPPLLRKALETGPFAYRARSLGRYSATRRLSSVAYCSSLLPNSMSVRRVGFSFARRREGAALRLHRQRRPANVPDARNPRRGRGIRVEEPGVAEPRICCRRDDAISAVSQAQQVQVPRQDVCDESPSRVDEPEGRSGARRHTADASGGDVRHRSRHKLRTARDGEHTEPARHGNDGTAAHQLDGGIDVGDRPKATDEPAGAVEDDEHASRSAQCNASPNPPTTSSVLR
jgi:hypothetical protein